ncbi:MAG: hypothetical protein KC912_24785 [Proteobacteria bacterium]|nr:hypothetical protein [Pseudomonadota bacterium]
MRHASLMVPILLTACVAGGGDGAWSFEDTLAVDAGLSNGELRIVSEDRADVSVVFSGGGVGRRAVQPEFTISDGVVTVDAMAGLFSGGELEIAVPLGTPVRGRVERGELSIELEAPAHVDACVATGDLEIRVPSGDYVLSMDVGVGDLDVAGVTHFGGASHALRGCVAAGSIGVYGD